MKKVLVAIFAILYLGASTGVTVNLHYCMGKLVAWGLEKESDSKRSCAYCTMTTVPGSKYCRVHHKGCCKDEQKLVQIEKDQKTVEPGFNVSKPFIQSNIHITPVDILAAPVFLVAVEYSVTHAPPVPDKSPVYIRNCVFRI